MINIFCLVFCSPLIKKWKADAFTSNIVAQDFKFVGQTLGQCSYDITLYFFGDTTNKIKQI